MKSYFYLLLAAVLSAASPILIEIYVNRGEKEIAYIIASFFVSVVLIMLYIFLCREYGATIMYALVKILAILFVAFISYVFLKEKITTKEIIGIIFGIIGLVLIST